MKIYTEINYEWKDGHLVETSSNSFDYYGLIEQCCGGGGTASDLTKKATTTLSDAGQAATGAADKVVKTVVEPVAEVASDVGSAATGAATDAASAISSGASSFTDTLADGTTAQVHLPPPTKPPPALGDVGKGLGKITSAVSEGVGYAGDRFSDIPERMGSGSGGTLGQVAGGVSNVGEQVSKTVTGGITEGLKAAETGVTNVVDTTGKGLEKLKSNALNLHKDIKGGLKYYRDTMAKKLGSDKIIGGLTDAAGSVIGGSGGPGSKSAPGVSETMGSKSSKITMKKAEADKRTVAKRGALGKRSLRKIA